MYDVVALSVGKSTSVWKFYLHARILVNVQPHASLVIVQSFVLSLNFDRS